MQPLPETASHNLGGSTHWYSSFQVQLYGYRTYETELIDYPYECSLKNGEKLSGNAQQLTVKVHQETAMEAITNIMQYFTPT